MVVGFGVAGVLVRLADRVRLGSEDMAETKDEVKERSTSMETNEMELPLSSSLAKYKVSHYSMRLALDMDGQRLHGEVILNPSLWRAAT